MNEEQRSQGAKDPAVLVTDFSDRLLDKRQMLDEIFGRPSFHGFKKLTDRIFTYFSYVNSTVVLADDGVCLIDTQVNSGQVKRLVAEIKKLTQLPVKYVINTHYHWDHVIGNRYFKEQGATIYGNEMTRHFMETRMKRQWAFLKGRGFTMDEPEPTFADVTFKGEMNLNLPGITLQLRHLGPTETDDATAIYFPREELVCTGDTLLTGSFPIFGMAVMSEGLREDREWLKTLEKIRALRCKNLIPGHGPLGDDKDLDLMVKIQTFFLDAMEKYVNDGLPLVKIQEKINQDLPDYIRKLPEVWGTVNYAIYRAYHSFTGWMDYKPSAIPWAKDDHLSRALAMAENDEKRIQIAIEKAMPERNFPLALSLCQELCERFPDNADNHALFAETLIESARLTSSILEKGDFFSLAKKKLDEAIELDPQCALALLVKGMFFVIRADKNGTDPEEGLQLLKRAAKSSHLSDKRKAKAHFGLSLGLVQAGKITQALEACRESVGLDPNFLPANKLLEELSKR